MKKLVLGAAIVFAAVMSAAAEDADDRLLPLFSGELDPALEFEFHNPPTYNDCVRLGWTRGVHVEIEGELESWMAICLKGEVPFSLDDENFKRHRNAYLKSKKSPTKLEKKG